MGHVSLYILCGKPRTDYHSEGIEERKAQQKAGGKGLPMREALVSNDQAIQYG